MSAISQEQITFKQLKTSEVVASNVSRNKCEDFVKNRLKSFLFDKNGYFGECLNTLQPLLDPPLQNSREKSLQ